jgi:pyridoxal phosphate enzyme (YggS family)
LIDETVTRINENYQRVTGGMASAARRVNRNPESIRLVVVTKLQPVELVEAAYLAGARYFGENYAEEALPKIQALSHLGGIEWHMIGHVQSRKARLVVENFSLLHSLDSLKLAERFEALLAPIGRRLPALLEFNLSGEESKSGWPAWSSQQWEGLLPELGRLVALPHLQVKGLMTMPPLFEDPEQARPFFRQLRRLQGYLAACFPGTHWDELSMGTSADYEVAVEEGATLVRIGQAILGPRLSR